MKLKYPELKLLSDFLIDVDPKIDLAFREESEADNRNALSVSGIGSYREEVFPDLIIRLARFWGCPEENLPEVAGFEASDSWHGRGEGDLRTLADELGKIYGQYYDAIISVQDIHDLAMTAAEEAPVGAVILRLEPTYEEFRDCTATGHGDTVLQALASLEKAVIAQWGEESALSDNHLLQCQLDLEELGIPGACIEFSDMSCPEDAFILRRLYVGDPYCCANCNHVDDYSELPPAKDLTMRCAPGDVFSDVECPQCGALCFPAPEFKYEPE